MQSEKRGIEQKENGKQKCVERREKQLYAMSNRKSLNCVTMLQNIATRHTWVLFLEPVLIKDLLRS